MKIQLTVCSLLVAGILVGCQSSSESGLEEKAKISMADAQATALKQAPNGTIKEAELERENGKLIWSVAIATPDTTGITEVNVDAMTGDIVNVEHENGGK